MKKFFVVMACLAFAGALQAQSLLTKGNPYATNVRTGNRPGAGDWGLYIGPSFSELSDIVASYGFLNFPGTLGTLEFLRGFPLVNVKYYSSDNLEFRGGIQYYKFGARANGTEIKPLADPTKDYEHSAKLTESYFRLIPGMAYHFSPRNVLDVYTGVSVPLGFEGYTEKDEYTGANWAGAVNNTYHKSLVVGLEAFIGLQAFVADLPLSIGLEYGLSGMFRTGMKEKHEIMDATGTIQTTYSDLLFGGTEVYSDLKANSGVFGSDIRLTITYYFNNK